MAGALERTYTFENVKFTVGGRNCAVSSIRLHLRQNGIPEARVVVDPVHGPDEAMMPATKATLDVITAWHTEFEGYAKERAAATLAFTATSALDTQKVDLKGWVCTAAGITGASAKGSFALEITIQHPVVTLDENSMHVGSLAERNEYQLQAYGNPLLAIKDMLRKYGEAKRVIVSKPCGSSPAAALQTAPNAAMERGRQKLIELSNTMSQYIEFDSGGGQQWPCQRGCLDIMKKELCNTIKGYLMGLDQSTLWETLSARFCPEWQLEILPVYWEEKLKMRPAAPWGKPEFTIYDDEISDLTYPGVDPAPLGGVAAQMQIVNSGDYSSFRGKEGDRHAIAAEVLYLPPDVINGKADGRIIPIEAPTWLQQIGLIDASAAGMVTAAGPNEEDHDNLRTPGNTAPGHTPASVSGPAFTARQDRIRGCLYHFAHAMFLMLYRQGVQTEVRTRLLVTPESGGVAHLTAGYCCSLKSRAGGAVFDFCIEQVIHSVDFQAGTAGTEIYGRYCRPPTGFGGMAYMDGGTPNPIY